MAKELDEIRRPLASLLSKSVKAQQNLSPGSWQHTMLAENIAALRLAMSLLFPADRKSKRHPANDLKEATTALTAMINRSVKAQAKFESGTSPHTLQRNRIKALRLAKQATATELKRVQAAAQD